MRIIDADALSEEFKSRAVSARNWKENALNCGNDEAVIRADATLAFLTEVKLTIENAPTVDPKQNIIVIPPELVKQLSKIVVDSFNKIPWSEALEAYNTRPHGEWLEDSGNIACSYCHTIWLHRRTDFCPHCGADMRGKEND